MAIGLLLAAFTLSCAQPVAPAQTPAFAPVDTLAPVSAAQARLDTARIRALVSDLQSGTPPGIHSLLIVRDGKIAVESYFNGSSAEQLHTLQSVSKSFSSALVGIAIARGVFSGVDVRVVDMFPALRAELELDPRRARQRIDDILTMRTGVDYTEGFAGSPHTQLNALRTGWDLFWLRRPMVSNPGDAWNYDSGGVIALSGMFKTQTGQHADVFAAEHLFAPLGIDRSRWYANDEGHPHMGGGLNLRTRDMAKFGQMYLQRGRWGQRQVVPAEWVDASLSEKVRFAPPRNRYIGYGYLWWRLPPGPGNTQPMHVAAGQYGQFIILVPEFNAVVVFTAGTPAERTQLPIEILYARVLPAFLR